jgi:hypothetical protein
MNHAMTSGGAGGDGGGRAELAELGPLDEVDLGLLADIREIFEAADPMPSDLPDRIRFGLAVRDLEVEMAWLAEEEDQLALAVRGSGPDRTVTFDSDSLTIMLRIDLNQDGTAHLDGWLAPAQRRDVEITANAQRLSVASDEQGRFAFARVPRGVARLLVRPSARAPDGAARTVATPALIL